MVLPCFIFIKNSKKRIGKLHIREYNYYHREELTAVKDYKSGMPHTVFTEKNKSTFNH
jgi:hypothetical protein